MNRWWIVLLLNGLFAGLALIGSIQSLKAERRNEPVPDIVGIDFSGFPPFVLMGSLLLCILALVKYGLIAGLLKSRLHRRTKLAAVAFNLIVDGWLSSVILRSIVEERGGAVTASLAAGIVFLLLLVYTNGGFTHILWRSGWRVVRLE